MFAASQQRYQTSAFRLAQLNPVPYIHRSSPIAEAVIISTLLLRPRLTAKQGQYLAFIHAYRRLLGQSPAEADMQRFFQVTSPSSIRCAIAQKAGLITRQPGIARSITLTIDPADLPELASRYDQPVKIAVQSY